MFKKTKSVIKFNNKIHNFFSHTTSLFNIQNVITNFNFFLNNSINQTVIFIFGNTSRCHFTDCRWALAILFLFYQWWQNVFLFLAWKLEKVTRRHVWRIRWLIKNHVQAVRYEWDHYHDQFSTNGCTKILAVSIGLLHANGAYLPGSISY